jgi:polysaccharide export outer membrane protein
MMSHRILTAYLFWSITGASVLVAQRAPLRSDSVAQRPSGIASDDQRLQAGDVVRVNIWREPALTGDFPVDESGVVTLPLIGRRQVTYTAWAPLRDSLITAFRRDVTTEVITIVPLRRVYVLGAVLRPGIYMLDPTMGVEAAVALAGGAAVDGNLERLRILRGGRVIVRNLSITAAVGRHPLTSGDQVFVDRRSWMDRNSALLLTSVLSIGGIIAALSRN